MRELPNPTLLPCEGSARFAGVAAGNFHSLAIDNDGRVFAWGSNARGRLGIGRALVRPAVPTPLPSGSFAHRRVVSIGCGLHHSVFLLEDGSVFTAGCNENGQLGRQHAFRSVTTAAPAPCRVELPEAVKIVRISSGRHHVLALDQDGEMWAWGKNDSGQLGILGQQDSPVPIVIEAGWGKGLVKMFDCGRNHSLVGTSNDELWAFGQNVDGQLGFQDRVDRHAPAEVELFRGWSLRQISCGSRQTSIVTSIGRVWSWGFILSGQNGVFNFDVGFPREFSEGFELNQPVAALHAGSTHTLIGLEDGSTAIVGENVDHMLCEGPDMHPDRVYPPCKVFYEDDAPFLMALNKEEVAEKQSALAQHLMLIQRSELDANVKLLSPTGTTYFCHRVVLQARCPRLLNVDIPESPRACRQLFEYIYGQRCDLSELTVLELVQIIQTVELCLPDLGMLMTQAEQAFMQHIYSSKEASIQVANNASVMESPTLSEWVKASLAEHLRSRSLNERDMLRLAQPLVIQASVLSHSQVTSRSSTVVREEPGLETFFIRMLESSVDSDFLILFDDEAPLCVHGCFVSRMVFFEAFLRNLRPDQPRKLLSKTPRSAMMALCRYLYGGELAFSPWDALYLMSPHYGVQFYFASECGQETEMDLVVHSMQAALMMMPEEDLVKALLKARELEIPQAESILIDLFADKYNDELENHLIQVQESHGEQTVLYIQRQVIRSLLTKVAIQDAGNLFNETMAEI